MEVEFIDVGEKYDGDVYSILMNGTESGSANDVSPYSPSLNKDEARRFIDWITRNNVDLRDDDEEIAE